MKQLDELRNEYEKVKKLKVRKGESPSLKGDAYNKIIARLLSYVKFFRVNSHGTTPTNQYDVTIITTFYSEKSMLVHEIGERIICECKNENKTPKNDYFGKLYFNMIASNANFGILFSVFPAPKTYIDMSREIYIHSQREKILLSLDDREVMMILDGHNLLDLDRKSVV